MIQDRHSIQDRDRATYLSIYPYLSILIVCKGYAPPVGFDPEDLRRILANDNGNQQQQQLQEEKREQEEHEEEQKGEQKGEQKREQEEEEREQKGEKEEQLKEVVAHDSIRSSEALVRSRTIPFVAAGNLCGF